MEAMEEPPIQNMIESAKEYPVTDEHPVLLAEANVCHTSNGVAESTTTLVTDAEYSGSNAGAVLTDVVEPPDEIPALDVAAAVAATSDVMSSLPDEEILAAIETNSAVEHLLCADKEQDVIEEELGSTEDIIYNQVTIDGSPMIMDCLDGSNEKVTLRTEVLVEKSEDDIPEPADIVDDHNNTNNILSDLSQGIEFSEALRSSNSHGENNNEAGREEVFNNEELLDILEGKDNNKVVTGLLQDKDLSQTTEEQIALKQLMRLNSKKKVDGKSPAKPSERGRRKRNMKKDCSESENAKSTKESSSVENTSVNQTQENEKDEIEKDNNKNEVILNELVKDWDDDEGIENLPSETSQLAAEADAILKSTEQVVKLQETVTSQNEVAIRTSVDSVSGDKQPNLNKSGDEGPPQRRLGRVIKKKVIFDPDNPDTFTKGKNNQKNKEPQVIQKSKEPLVIQKIIKETQPVLKNKEAQPVQKNKEPQSDKEQPPPPKKIKPEQTLLRAKSKSPIAAKMQWKKPTPTKAISKTNKRLTEVEKLLMDEGAVNMIYQLTPEAPKGKKNVRTKAEFIKKIQSSSTPEGNEMKFRERKKEIKIEEGVGKKAGKSSRSSLSGSVKSLVGEDFETHSADDSIIYRRHSSSSYSSACMSPRRLSDVEAGTARSSQADTQNKVVEVAEDEKKVDIFMAEDASQEIINKKDCLTMKEKLNAKLYTALNKRKREVPKNEKPPKQKRMSKNTPVKESIKLESLNSYKHITLEFGQRIAEIGFKKSELGYGVEMLKELERALVFVNNKKDVSVTLLTSECGSLTTELDMSPLMVTDMQKREQFAFEIAEAIRSVLNALERHSKLVVSWVWEACAGSALGLLALSDVVLAYEHASFGLDSELPMPAAAALVARHSRISHTMVKDMVLFSRRVSATEAAAGGLVTRVLPLACLLQVRSVVKEYAQPRNNIILKKSLLNLDKNEQWLATFRASLEKERNELVEYWTAVGGSEMLLAANSSES